ncbi:MAG: MGMT family protein, partial [Patescibacteria group bacterium]
MNTFDKVYKIVAKIPRGKVTTYGIVAKKLGISTKIIHNASIINAIGITGLQLYKFGKVSSIPFENDTIEVPYDNLKINLKNDM